MARARLAKRGTVKRGRHGRAGEGADGIARQALVREQGGEKARMGLFFADVFGPSV
ncbi:hypothetical protein [uncultured Lentibacter sp.]|uniref:hypothetical protein n=1 Tax=uncultured Lentibacter sp. TaxID=1659309 RepID=UPI002624C630|nr:hypothetical protein [uncultured Lentibacter sp.]